MSPDPTRRRGVALLVGISEYRHDEQIPALRFAHCDARALAWTLRDPRICGLPREQVHVVTDRRATRARLAHLLSEWLPAAARDTDLAVLYFAGHGTMRAVNGADEGFLLPHDADPDDPGTCLAMTDVANWIRGLTARAVVVCMDCCHAGRVLTRDADTDDARPRDMVMAPPLLQKLSGRGRFLIAACDEGQKSLECPELGHGLFTYHLLQGMNGAAARDATGRLGVAALFNYVSAAVARDAREKYAWEQKPWTSAVWAEEVYLVQPRVATPSDPALSELERKWRNAGASALALIEAEMTDAPAERLVVLLRFLRRKATPEAVPVFFRHLAHAQAPVREQARKALHALDWDKVVATVEEQARAGDARLAEVLDGLAAFEAHRDVVALLDRLVALLKGDLRNRAILLQERKVGALELESVAALLRATHSPYRLERVLGAGLFTTAYLGRGEMSELRVVIRVLRPEPGGDPALRGRFLDLSSRVLPMVHQNLVLTREVRAFPEQHLYFTVRDYVEGLTLRHLLESGKRFTPEQVVRLLHQVTYGLGPLHRAGLAHGGIKPSKIFVCADDRVVLADPALPATAARRDLPRLSYDYRYLSPLALRAREQLPPAADYYPMGCVAYELLCGAPPFVSDFPDELLVCHGRDPIPPLARRVSDLHPALDELVGRLLSRDPAAGFDNLQSLRQALAACEEALIHTAPPAAVGTASAPPVPAAAPLLRDDSLAQLNEAASLVSFHYGRPTETCSELGPMAVPPVEVAARPVDQVNIPGYQIVRELGRGGMGVVYHAVQTALGRPVAIKMIRAGKLIGPEVRERFRREALAVAKLLHPNIVQIYDTGEVDNNPYVVLEWVDGGNLSQRIQQGPVPPQEAVGLVETLAQAADFAHRQGIIHRDLKPSNILLTRDGVPKISDFGLARDVERDSAMTQAGMIIGTPSYMAPEQAAGKIEQFGPAMDVYSLGVILYQCLSGRLPFRAGSAMEMVLEVMQAEPPPLRALNPTCPPELEAICHKCLAKAPTDRYATAADLAADLRRFLADEPISAHPQPRLLQPFRKRWRVLMRRVGVGLSLLLAGGGLLLLLRVLLGW
jgi:serine/threonine protein kinase